MIGERVRLAREACRLTQQELAESAGISQKALSELEAGRVITPAEDTIDQVSRATSFPISFFYLGPLPDLPEGHYRRLKRGTAKVGKQVRAQVRQVVELVQRSEDELRLPPVALEPIRELAELSDIEAVAREVRAALRVGQNDPIPNLTRAVERTGAIVVRLASSMEDHDGFSAWPDFGLGGRPIIAVSGDRTGDRHRFTVAHELGHIVLHTIRRQVDPLRAETEANRFAGSLLLPKEAALSAMRPPITLRALMGIKATFGLSIAAGAQRALDLDLISREQFVSLRKQLSARHWNKQEPVEVVPENPLLISKVISILSGSTGSTLDRAARVSMPLFTYRALVGE